MGETESMGASRAAAESVGWHAAVSGSRHHSDTHSDGAHLSVLTYNLLCPGYFRKNETKSKKKMEASHREAWMPRLRQQLRVLVDASVDVCAVQELWMKQDVISMLQEAMPPDRFVLLPAQRTGKKEDGVALVIRTARWRVLRSCVCACEGAGDRVSAFALLESTIQPGVQVVVAATHLTFPHYDSDLELRLAQAQCIITRACAFTHACVCEAADAPSAAGQPKRRRMPLVVAGDFNHVDDAAMRYFHSVGMRSAFAAVHAREVAVTHVTHTGELAGVDFVLCGEILVCGMRHSTGCRMGRDVDAPCVEAVDARVLPEDTPDHVLMPRPVAQLAPVILAAATSARDCLHAAVDGADAAPGGARQVHLGGDVAAVASDAAAARQDSVRTAGSTTGRPAAALAEAESAAAFVGAFEAERSMRDLTFTDFCNLSDHRPVRAELFVRR